MTRPHPRLIFGVIVFAQFCGTSLWFAGNAALGQLQQQVGWPASAVGHLTGAVQLGFIAGTLFFAFLAVADKFSPSRIFFLCCLGGAASNALSLADSSSFTLVLVSRGLTGFCLAGIYPVGMKLAADWQEKGLGRWLGALVGALVLGTAFPHGMKLIPHFIQVGMLLPGVSVLALAGGLSILLLVPDGPYRKKGSRFSFAAAENIFGLPAFRAPAFGYFGHMWELYAFWAFTPWAVEHYLQGHPSAGTTETLAAFVIIASGAVGCVAGGWWSARAGSERVAFYALLCSGLCCILSPLLWQAPPWLFFTVMIFWGMTVAADSPQFSTLVARHAPEHLRGSALTLVTCIEFGITIVSIQLLSFWQHTAGDYLFLALAPGPAAGLLAMRKVI